MNEENKEASGRRLIREALTAPRVGVDAPELPQSIRQLCGRLANLREWTLEEAWARMERAASIMGFVSVEQFFDFMSTTRAKK